MNDQELETIKLQRDELLDMLELVMDEWRIGWRYGSEANGFCPTYNQAVALIAKVKKCLTYDL